MNTKAIKRWVLTALLGLLVVGAACAPIPDATSTDQAPPTGAAGEPADGGESVDVGDSESNVTVDAIELLLMESFPIQVAALVRGHFGDGCGVLDGVSARRTSEGFVIEIAAHREGDFCTTALVPFEERVALDVNGLQAGTYAVRAGGVSAEFTFDVDNTSTEGADMDTIQDLRGTVTAIERGKDGIQVELVDGEAVYSVTISVMQAEVFGGLEEIRQGVDLLVSGATIAGMQPTLVVAERVVVVGSDSDHVLNLRGTVTGIEPAKDGYTAQITAPDGATYTATISLVTTNIVYVGSEQEIRVGAPVLLSGTLFDLDGAHIAADTAVVHPVPPTDTTEDRPSRAGD